jgi:predicted ATPase
LATLTTEHGFTGVNALGMCIHGWAQSKQASGEEGATLIQRGMDGWQATGALINRPFHLTLLAEAYRESEQVEDGLNVLLEAIALVEDTGERYWEAEIYRLKGELLLQQSKDNQTEAESCYQNALEVSRHQQAKSLELRAATSLARLWQSQGKREEARELLEPVYGWFTEGFDTADLIDAKTLLDELLA